MDYLWIIRSTMALITGLIVARKMRATLRMLVVRLMPVKLRMSDRSFYIQSRMGILLAFIVAIGIAIIVDSSLKRIFKNADWGIKRVEKGSWQEVSPPDPLTFNLPAATEKEVSNTEVSPDEHMDQQQTNSAPSSETRPQSYSPRTQAIDAYYLQLNAYQNIEYAYAFYETMYQMYGSNIKIGHLANDKAPYKVLAGPFDNRNSAVALKAKYQTHSFPRKLGKRGLSMDRASPALQGNSSSCFSKAKCFD
jgi:hypothetical protein